MALTTGCVAASTMKCTSMWKMYVNMMPPRQTTGASGYPDDPIQPV